MFPEKVIIDVLTHQQYTQQSENSLNKFYNETEYDFVIDDFTVHDVLMHPKSNTILSQSLHSPYYYGS